MAAVLTKRRLALTALLGVYLALGGCSSFSGLVSDTWPTWAGGEPKDVPPRPGAPGYEQFIAHQQREDPAAATAAPAGAPAQAGAAPVSAAPATTGRTPTTAAAAPASNPAVNRAAPQQFPPAYARPDDSSTTKGGLY